MRGDMEFGRAKQGTGPVDPPAGLGANVGKGNGGARGDRARAVPGLLTLLRPFAVLRSPGIPRFSCCPASSYADDERAGAPSPGVGESCAEPASSGARSVAAK